MVKATGDNGASPEKASALEGKKEDQKGKSTHSLRIVFHLLKILTCSPISTNTCCESCSATRMPAEPVEKTKLVKHQYFVTGRHAFYCSCY